MWVSRPDHDRLGSHASGERISQSLIETREMVAGQSRLDHTYNSKHRELKSVGTEIFKLIESMHKNDLKSDSSEIASMLDSLTPNSIVSLSDHLYISALPRAFLGAVPNLGESGKGGRRGQVTTQNTLYTRSGRTVAIWSF